MPPPVFFFLEFCEGVGRASGSFHCYLPQFEEGPESPAIFGRGDTSEEAITKAKSQAKAFLKNRPDFKLRYDSLEHYYREVSADQEGVNLASGYLRLEK